MLNDFVVDPIEKPTDDDPTYTLPVETPEGCCDCDDDDDFVVEPIYRIYSDRSTNLGDEDGSESGSESDEDSRLQKAIDTGLDLVDQGTDAYEAYLASQNLETRLAIEREITARKRLDAQKSEGDDDDEGLLSSPWLILGGIAGMLFLNSRRR